MSDGLGWGALVLPGIKGDYRPGSMGVPIPERLLKLGPGTVPFVFRSFSVTRTRFDSVEREDGIYYPDHRFGEATIGREPSAGSPTLLTQSTRGTFFPEVFIHLCTSGADAARGDTSSSAVAVWITVALLRSSVTSVAIRSRNGIAVEDVVLHYEGFERR